MATEAKKKVAEMPDDVFNACVKAAMESGKDKLKMTNEEQEQFMSAMKKPEFTKLMKEYMDEISDPKYREEQETYLRQLEKDNQVPENMRLAYPKAGFAVKTKRLEQGKEAGKIFINVCSLEELEPPSAQRGPKGVSWSLPYSLGPMRHEKDNRGEAHPTFDFALHPDVLRRCARDDRFRKMVIDTALDAVDKRIAEVMKADVKINRMTARVLQNIACIGGKPAVMQIGVDKENKRKQPTPTPTRDACPKENVQEQKTAKEEQAKGAKPSAPHKGIEVLSETAAAEAPPAPEVASNEPKYTISHRGKLELTDFVQDERLRARTALIKRRPKELVMRVQVPKIKSAKYLDIETSENLFKLVTAPNAPAEYELSVDLPFPVDKENGSAKFDKTSRVLEVVLPVRPPTEEDVQRHEELIRERMAASAETSAMTSEPEASASLVQEVDAGQPVQEQKQQDQEMEGKADSQETAPEEAKTCARQVRFADAEEESAETTVEEPSKAETPEDSKLAEILAAAKAAAALPLPRLEDNLQQDKETEPATVAATSVEEETPSTADVDPDSEMEAALSGNQEGDQSVEEEEEEEVDPDFQPQSAFAGARAGFVFKRGEKGLGYYRDRVAAAPTSTPAVKPTASVTEEREEKNVAPRTAGTTSKADRLALRNKSIFELD